VNSKEDVQTAAAALHVAISLFTRRARESKTGELSLPERTALSRLDRNGPDTTAGLARREEISPQAMGVTVSALESKGFVQRSADPTDARRSILTITGEGVSAVRASRGQLTDRISRTLDEQFSPDEIAQIRSATPLIERLAELI
jgi:DNA-binding MarR family transcriptional regulator